MEISLIISAFIAGLFMFLAPCTLPLVPAYLSFITGVDKDHIQKARKSKKMMAQLHRRVFINGLFYVLGFSVVFIIFGMLAGFVGARFLGQSRILFSKIGGIFVILFGLFVLDIIRVPALQTDKRFVLPHIFRKGRPESSFLLGASFAFGWTPCVGPILASILLLASTSSTAFQGGILLSVFSAGMAVPFLIIAWGIGSAYARIKKLSTYMAIISKLGGIFLIVLGILLFTDNLGSLIAIGYSWFGKFGYRQLQNFY